MTVAAACALLLACIVLAIFYPSKRLGVGLDPAIVVLLIVLVALAVALAYGGVRIEPPAG